jgi:hypothetical protein
MATEKAPTSCANCGKSEELEAKLETCKACKAVKYCGRGCQIAHRNRHKKECKKRAAELHEEALFKEPPKPDDCPIRFLPLTHGSGGGGQRYFTCCGKMVCSG